MMQVFQGGNPKFCQLRWVSSQAADIASCHYST
jgi:hypothetical protein